MKACTFIDHLFCGCGGFSLGMERAGFTNLAAIDFNKEVIATFQKNWFEFPVTRMHQFHVIGKAVESLAGEAVRNPARN